MVMITNPAKTVLHGIDQAGSLANRPNNAPDGFAYYVQDLARLIIRDARHQTWVPADSRALMSPIGNFAVDHFRETLDVSTDGWNAFGGSDPQALAPVQVAGTDGVGQLSMTSGNVDGTAPAVDGSILDHSLSWLVSEGVSQLRCRYQIDVITAAYFFIGFTDVLAATTPEAAVTLSSTTFTTDATDACGFMFDTDATSDNIWCTGVAGGTDAVHVDSAIAPVAATDMDLAIDLLADGSAKFWINGVLIATIAACAATTAALTPVLHVEPRTTSSRILLPTFFSCDQK